MDKIFYINLQYRTDKKEKIEKLLTKLNFTFERIDASYDEPLPTFIDPVYIKNKETYNLSKSEYNTILSHLKAWDKCVSNTLILEDDIIINPLYENNFHEHLDNCIKNIPQDWDIVFLGGCYTRHEYLKQINPYYRKYIISTKETPWFNCCHAYIIKPTTIEKLKNKQIHGPIDNWLSSLPLNIYSLKSSIFIQDKMGSDIYHCSGSNIEYKKYMIIPKIIHQIWFQGNPPEYIKQWSETFKKLNPDYQYILWDKNSIEQLNISEKYYTYTHDIEKIDYAKLVILKNYGGIYIDIDFICLKPITELFFGKTFFITKSKETLIANALIACTPNNHIINYLLNKYDDNNYHHANFLVNIMNNTGPLFITQCLNEMKFNETEFIDNNIGLYYPQMWIDPREHQKDNYNLSMIDFTKFKNSFMVHIWGGFWRKDLI